MIFLPKIVCGNQEIESGEECDDGGIIAGNGCSATCLIEAGYECSGIPSVCNLLCSNGEINTGEDCDDNNTNNGDGCDSTCKVETGFTCVGVPSSCISSIVYTCGDGQISDLE